MLFVLYMRSWTRFYLIVSHTIYGVLDTMELTYYLQSDVFPLFSLTLKTIASYSLKITRCYRCLKTASILGDFKHSCVCIWIFSSFKNMLNHLITCPFIPISFTAFFIILETSCFQ